MAGKSLNVTRTTTTEWPSSRVSSLGVDGHGRIWVASDQPAVYRFDGKELVCFTFDEDNSMSLGVFASGGERVFFATNWGVLQVAGEAFTLFDADNSPLHDTHVTGIAMSPGGDLYVLSYDDEEPKQASILARDGSWRTHAFPEELEGDVACLGVAPSEKLILGTWDGPWIEGDGGWKGPSDLELDDSVEHIVTAGDTVYLAGIHIHSYRGGKLQQVSDQSAHRIAVAADGLWLASSFEGVVRWKNGEATQVPDTEEGLSDLQAVAVDAAGSLYVAFAEGVARIVDGKLEMLSASPRDDDEPEEEDREKLPFPEAILQRAQLPAPLVKQAQALKLEALTADHLLAVVRPAVGLRLLPKGDVPLGSSKLGGLPDLPEHIDWPLNDDDQPMPFVAQVRLEDLADFDREKLLPPKGMLYFFSDTQPDSIDYSAVRFFDGKAPLKPNKLPEALKERDDEDDFIARFPEHRLQFFQHWTLPGLDFFRQRAELKDADEEALEKLAEALRKHSGAGRDQSQLLGWPTSIQQEMAESEDDVVLLQLFGSGFGDDVDLEAQFIHWCGDGAVQFPTKVSSLRERDFDCAGEMTFT